MAAVDLYLKALVTHDEQALRQLNDYLRADRVRTERRPDYADIAALKKADQEFPEEVAKLAQNLFPATMQPTLKEPLVALMATVQQARQKSECKAVSASEPVAQGKYGVLTSAVRFECAVVKVPENWAKTIQRLVRDKASLAETHAELNKLQAAYAAPVNFKYEGTFSISTVPQDKDEAWRNDFAREPIDEIFSDL